MKNSRVILAVACLTLSIASLADKGPMPPRPSSPAFVQLQQLIGSWKGTVNEDKGPQEAVVEYRITSGGSAVEERIFVGTPHEMVSIYYEENGKLAMTHYCMLGNHPHMTLQKFSPKEIDLAMSPGHGVSINDRHMHALALQFIDSDHLIQRWTCYEHGKAGKEAVLILNRVK